MIGFSKLMRQADRTAARIERSECGHAMRVLLRALALLAIAFLCDAARASDASLCALARQSGTPQVPGLTIIYLSPLGDPAAAKWENIIVHQMEGPAGAAKNGAQA